jgi:hypothetical protein
VRTRSDLACSAIVVAAARARSKMCCEFGRFCGGAMGTHTQPRGADVAMCVRIGVLVAFVATASTAANVWAGVIAWTISSLTFHHGVMSLIDVLLRAAGQLARQGRSQGEFGAEGTLLFLVTLVNAAAAWMVFRKRGGAHLVARRIRSRAS